MSDKIELSFQVTSPIMHEFGFDMDYQTEKAETEEEAIKKYQEFLKSLSEASIEEFKEFVSVFEV